MSPPLSATIEPLDGDDGPGVALRITNTSGAPVELLNPDLGRPSAEMKWPFSLETYRASLLMSYGYLAVSVTDEHGEPVDKQPVETWVTPILNSPVALSPGESLDVPIPLGPFFALAPGQTYRVLAEYGDDALKVSGEGALVRDR
jgi:hypothetical protein